MPTEADDPKYTSAATSCSASSWHDDVLFAFEEAAAGIESWEYGGADTREEYDQQSRAAKEVAKRIRSMARRYESKHLT